MASGASQGLENNSDSGSTATGAGSVREELLPNPQDANPQHCHITCTLIPNCVTKHCELSPYRHDYAVQHTKALCSLEQSSTKHHYIQDWRQHFVVPISACHVIFLIISWQGDLLDCTVQFGNLIVGCSYSKWSLI